MHKAKIAMEQGAGTDQAMRAFIPPIHFRRESVVGTALKSWAASRLERTMTQLAEAVLETRRQAALADAIAQRTLLSIAVNARRRGD
jgi:DNA polymerase-3 subunit delta